MQGKGKKKKITEAHKHVYVQKVCLIHTTRKKGKLGEKLNNGISLPFTTIFHAKHKCFVLSLLCWCKAATEPSLLFVISVAPKVYVK